MQDLSQRAREILAQNKIDIQLIVEIDGIDMVFGVSPVRSIWKVGDAGIKIGQKGLIIGGNIINPKSKGLIDAKGSTKNISQQLETDLGVSSISTVRSRFLDVNNLMTEILSPSGDFDIMNRGCTVYLGFLEGSHPEDSIKIFDGVVSDCGFGQGYVDLDVSHPEQLKRQAIFPKWESKVIEAIPSATADGEDESTPSPTTITLEEDASDLITTPEEEGFYTYFKIGDEIFSFGNIDKVNKTLSILRNRNMFQTPKDDHDANESIETFYYLTGNPIDISLKLLCSTKEGFLPYVDDMKVLSVEGLGTGETAVRVKVETNDLIKYNIQINDEIRLFANGAGTHPPENLYPERSFKVNSIINQDKFSYLVGNTAGYVSDSTNSYKISAVSKWNVYGEGCGIPNRYIDFQEFDKLRTLYSSEMTDCQIFIKDTIDDAKDFIDKVILRPQGMYSLPRKGRISIGKTKPPIADQDTVVLNEKNIINAKDIKIKRSINSGFYNAVIYKYTEHATEDKFMKGEVVIDQDSNRRIKIGNRPLIIEAKSLRDSPDAQKVIESQTKRILERYKYGVEVMEGIKIDPRAGFNLDIGDTVVCQFEKLKVSDITNGSRNFAPRLMEITNKSLNFSTGEISLDLANTVFEVDGRYATISPSSWLSDGSTSTVLRLTKSFSRKDFANEKGKWDQYIGQKLIVRSEDWESVEETTITGIDPVLDAIIVDELTLAPLKGYVIESPYYDDTSKNNMILWKRLHAYINPTVEIVSLVSPNEVEVAPEDIDKFLPKSVVYIHDDLYENKSDEVYVDSVDITNNIVKFSKSISYVPVAGELIELIGFKDGGLPYRVI